MSILTVHLLECPHGKSGPNHEFVVLYGCIYPVCSVSFDCLLAMGPNNLVWFGSQTNRSVITALSIQFRSPSAPFVEMVSPRLRHWHFHALRDKSAVKVLEENKSGRTTIFQFQPFPTVSFSLVVQDVSGCFRCIYSDGCHVFPRASRRGRLVAIL